MCVCVCVCLCVCACMCACMCVCLSVSVYMSVCIRTVYVCKLSSVIIPVENPNNGECHYRDASMAVHPMGMLRWQLQV